MNIIDWLVDWLDAQGTEEAHAARDELTSLRAFKAACERQEAVAEVYRYGKDSAGRAWHGIHWYDHALDVPTKTKLYLHPDPEAASLRMQVKELEQEYLKALKEKQYENNELQYQVAQLATSDQQVTEACAKVSDSVDTLASSNPPVMISHMIRSGEWKKHMKGAESDRR